jgi:TonB-linked SusC/RagA family outer membrane protein
MKKAIFLLLLVILPLAAFAQRNVSGTITDAATGEALLGVTVQVKGTSTGVITDGNGAYTVGVRGNADTLIFSYVGFVTAMFPVSNQSVIDYAMIAEVTDLEEVIVVGYGTQKKLSVTNAVSNITSDELSERTATNMTQALQGKLPGLTIIDYGGAPGDENLIMRVRGVTSLNSNVPLVLIDGVPGDMTQLNPVDIESVTVLKDAASAAIYGSRAAAGVILVTTKDPGRGKLDVSYNGYFGMARTNNNPVHMEAVDYMNQQNAAWMNSYGFQYYSDQEIADWPQNHANDPEMYPLPNTWHDAVFSPAPQHSHTLTLSGGTDVVNTRISARYMSEDGVMRQYGFEIAELRAKTNFKVSDRLDLLTNVNVRNTLQKAPYNSWGTWSQANYRTLQNSQWGVPRYSDGSYGLTVDSYSPLILLDEVGKDNQRNTNITGIFRAEYEIIDGLKAIAQYSTKLYYGYNHQFWNKYYFEDKLHPSRVTFNSLNRMQDHRSQSRENGIDLQLTYNKIFGNHTVSAIAAYSQIHFQGSNLSGYRQDFYNNDLQSLSLGIDDATRNGWGGNSEWALRSYFARANYDFAGRYLLEANVRYDGSSRFSEGNRFGLFPSFSAGWRISNEAFWGSLKNTVNELKFRGSWGQVGSQTVGLYTYIETYNQSNYIFNNSLATGYRQTDLASQDLSWETTTQFNVGLDAYLFANRVNISADYYIKTTEDILLAVPIPSLIGLNPTDQNAGSVENRGIEVVLGGRQSFGDWNVGLNLNLNYNKNKVLDLAGTGPHISAYGNSDWRTITTEGEPILSFYGYETDGLFQTQEEVDAYATWDGSVGPGDVKYVDQNNDGVLNTDDFVIYGKEMPDITYAINMSVGWKGLTLDLFWQGVAGSEKLVTGATEEHGIWGGFTHKVYTDYWTPENTDAEYPRPTKYTMKNAQISDRWMVNGAYLRLKNIRLSYDIPQNLCNRLKISGINVYVSATNLLTFAELNKYNIDPELVGRGPESSYPQTSVTSIGLNINF